MKQPFLDKEGLYICPICFEEMWGDGENHVECGCGYIIHEVDIKDDLITLSSEEIEKKRKIIMKLFLVDYYDYEEPNWYLFVAHNEAEARLRAEEEYKSYNDTLDGFKIEDIHPLTEVDGYKIEITKL